MVGYHILLFVYLSHQLMPYKIIGMIFHYVSKVAPGFLLRKYIPYKSILLPMLPNLHGEHMYQIPVLLFSKRTLPRVNVRPRVHIFNYAEVPLRQINPILALLPVNYKLF